MLQKVIDLWQSTDFRLVPHVSGSVAIIAGADDIMAQLEESQVTIGTIRGSRYVQPIKVWLESIKNTSICNELFHICVSKL